MWSFKKICQWYRARQILRIQLQLEQLLEPVFKEMLLAADRIAMFSDFTSHPLGWHYVESGFMSLEVGFYVLVKYLRYCRQEFQVMAKYKLIQIDLAMTSSLRPPFRG